MCSQLFTPSSQRQTQASNRLSKHQQMMIFSTQGNKNSRLWNSAEKSSCSTSKDSAEWIKMKLLVLSLCAAPHTVLEKQTKSVPVRLSSRYWEDFDSHAFSHLKKMSSHLLIIESFWSCHGRHSCRFLILEVWACQSCPHDKNIRSIWSFGSSTNQNFIPCKSLISNRWRLTF